MLYTWCIEQDISESLSRITTAKLNRYLPCHPRHPHNPNNLSKNSPSNPSNLSESNRIEGYDSHEDNLDNPANPGGKQRQTLTPERQREYHMKHSSPFQGLEVGFYSISLSHIFI